MSACLFDFRGNELVQLPDTAIFGRHEDSTIRLPDVRVSRRHAMIRRQDEDTWWFYDLGSYNGSFLNGRRVTTTSPLAHGDVITICETHFRFLLESPAPKLNGRGSSAPAKFGDARAQAVGALAMGKLEREGESAAEGPEWVVAPMIVLVSDIKGFTRLSELLAPEDLAQAIGTWYGECEAILGEHGASIDKFIGDAVLAYWTDVSPHARARALDASKALRQATYGIHDSMRPIFDAVEREFSCGVAVHVGDVSHGELAPGTLTMLGDAVNTTFRIQNLTRSLGCDVLASGDFFHVRPTWDQGRAYATPLGFHELRGRSTSIELFAVDNSPRDFE